MPNSRILGQVSRRISALALGLLCLAASIPVNAQSSLLARKPDFDSRSLIGSGNPSVSGVSLADPNRFSMHQSYSVTAMSGGAGSSSSGLYLNTIGYKISDPLQFFMDVGMYTPLHSTGAFANENSGAAATSLVLPRFGLEYKPSDRLTVNFEWVNGPDAYKAYGRGYGYGASPFYGSRFP